MSSSRSTLSSLSSATKSNKTNKDPPEESCGCAQDDSDICFVDGSLNDKDVSMDQHDITNTVWNHTKPPFHFGSTTPLVSARKIYVTRAHLTGKMCPKRPNAPSQSMVVEKCMRKATLEREM